MGEADDWRADVLHAMLRIAAWLVPVVGVVAILSRTRPYADWSAVVIAVCLVGFVVLGAMGRRLPSRVRAWGALVALYLPAATAVTRSGFAPGAAACAMACVVFAAIFLGRGAMLAVLGVVGSTYVGLGLQLADGLPLERVADLDPRHYRNWLRTGFVLCGLSYLVGTVVWFVIRQVEAGRERAARAAEELRVAYLQLVRLHRRLSPPRTTSVGTCRGSCTTSWASR
jgi:hypothetical protein